MKTTAIIAKDHSDFKEFVKKLDPGVFYIFVDSIYKTRGIEFSEVIITDNVEQKGSFFELYNACKLRIRPTNKDCITAIK